MKKTYKFYHIFILFGLFLSCSEEDPIESSITSFPTFEVTEGQYLMTKSGEAFIDPGVISRAGETELPVTVSGAVDTSQIGVYKLTYSAENSDGFSATATRYVAVVDDPAAIAANDLSASYTRDSNSAQVMTLNKIVGGFYQADDVLPNNNLRALIVQVSDTQLVIPFQSSRFGSIIADEFNDAETSAALVGGKDISLSLRIGSFGVFNRNFIKN